MDLTIRTRGLDNGGRVSFAIVPEAAPFTVTDRAGDCQNANPCVIKVTFTAKDSMPYEAWLYVAGTTESQRYRVEERALLRGRAGSR